MFIKSIRLVGYKPISILSNIDVFEWEPSALLMLILGTNGSGKTSLLREINPLPANRSDYRPGGSKRVVVEHCGQTYILESTFVQGNKHSFIQVIDGVEKQLNESATITIQKELVETTFNYTPMIHQVLTGEIKFTEMSPAARKDLLLTICPLELDYALELFQKTKVLNRDNEGALKHLVNKNTDIRARLGTIENTDVDEDIIEEWENELKLLLPFEGLTEKNSQSLMNTINNILADLEKGVATWDKFKQYPLPDNGITDIEKLQTEIAKQQTLFGRSKEAVAQLTNELMSLDEVIHRVEENQMSVEEIKAELRRITTELERFYSTEVLAYPEQPVYQAIALLMERVENTLQNEEVVVFDQDTIESKQAEFLKLSREKQDITVGIGRLQDRLKHLTETDVRATCPQCQLHFSLAGGDADSEIKRIKERIEKGERLLEELVVKLTPLETVTQQIAHYEHIKGIITGYYRSLVNNVEFMRGLPSVDATIRSLTSFNTYCSLWLSKLESSQEKKQLLKESEKYQQALEFAELGNNVYAKKGKLEQQIEKELISQSVCEDLLGQYEAIAKQYNYFRMVTEKCEEMVKRLDDTLLDWAKATVREDAKARISFIYERLGSTKHLVMEKRNLTQSLEENERDVEALKEKQQDSQLLMELLSPTKGEIAFQMQSFINSLIDEINKITRTLWAYTLHVLPCGVEGESLDYKFPMMVEGENISDISLGSEGQKELINLAFTLIIREYLNLHNYPIFLDETGANFDEAHRDNLMRFIKSSLDSHQCSQVFMINHYATFHGGLVNHEVVVLDDRNIVVPNCYNENVKIAYRS